MSARTRTRGIGDARALDAAALTATMTVMLAGVTVVTPLIPHYRERWDLGVTLSTLIFVLYIAGILVALIGLGQLADAIGGRIVLLAALLLGVVATVVALVAPDPGWLLVARVLQGIGVGLVPGATVAALAGAGVTPSRVSLLVSLATTTGIAVGLILGGVLAPAGTTVTWLVYLTLLLVATARAATDLMGRARPTTRRWQVRRPAMPDHDRRPFVLALAGAAVAFAAMGVFAGVGPSMVASHRGNPVLVGAVIAAAAYLVSGAIQLTVARRHVLARSGAVLLVLGMTALGLAVRSQSVPVLLTAAVLVGVGNGLMFPPTLLAAHRLAPEDRRAGVVSTYYLAMYAGISLPLLGLGALADATSLTVAIEIFAVVVGTAALVLAVLGPASPGPRDPDPTTRNTTTGGIACLKD